MSRFNNELLNFTSLPRELIFDKSLSDRARFVYCFMACKPNDWDFYLEPMATELGYSVDTLRKYITELVKSGWLEKGEQEREKGVFKATLYTLKSTKKTDSEKNGHGKNPTQHNKDTIHNKEEIKDNNTSVKNDFETDEFIDRMYKLYPTKCPKREQYLGKCKKDKMRIKSLLKQYSMQEIEFVFKHEIEQKYGKHYMSNLSTFLNNFPDPNTLGYNQSDENGEKIQHNALVINGQVYR